MAALLYAVQKVELVSNESWWSENGGSVLLACAAIAAASVAAGVAIWNLRRQFAHERDLRNREHIRDTVDEAARRAGDLRTSIDKLIATVHSMERAHDRAAEAGEPLSSESKDDWADMVMERKEECVECLYPAREVFDRLALRLEVKDPIVSSYHDLHNALHAYLSAGSPKMSGDPRPQELRDQDEERKKEVARNIEDFREACREWFNR